ncbi:MAG: ABC transporter permease [Acidimicrobiales bacterium]
MSDAQIIDRGYRAYEGPRGGVGASMLALIKHSLQRVLGIKRTIWQKIMPITSILIAYVPAIVFVGIAALIDSPRILDEILPSYGEYYGFVTAAIILFVAFVGPELLCTDRRTGMLGLYLASPVDRDRYLLAKMTSIALVLSIVTIGPQLLMLLSFTFEGTGPGPAEFVKTLVQIVLGGLAISTLHTSLSMAISSLTDRRTVAAAAIIMLLLVSGAVSSAFVDGAGLSHNYELLNLFGLPFALAVRIFGERAGFLSSVSTGPIVAAYLAWTVLGAIVVRWRYQRMLVTR